MHKILTILAVATGVLLCVPTFAQRNFLGRVFDAQSNLPLSGATIKAGTIRGTTSDANGNFTFKNLPQDIDNLEVTFVGYEKKIVSSSEFRVLGSESNVQRPTSNVQILLKRSIYQADEVVVSATRTNALSAMAYSNVSAGEISKSNLGQDLPVLLNFTPSLVTTSDAGGGVGYTGMRIRGSDATRINVTINGIPLNDAESHGVYWVNMPDFASSVSSVQVQRGVGTSTNGAGAFGATVNVQTNEFKDKAYAELNNSVGSFNTLKNTLKFGSGLLKNRFTIDARLSKISSDGFLDRASSNLRSGYLSAAYFGKKSMIRANVFSGKEITYQAWEGTPESRLKGDLVGMKNYIDRNGLIERDAQNLLNSDSRTYNLYLYDNQVDNYKQNHFQLVTSHTLNDNWTVNVNAFLVRGLGYYEQFKDDQKIVDYKLTNTTVKSTDLVRRRWLDNYFYGTTFSTDYNSFKKLKANIGGGWNQYNGQHYGQVIWAKLIPNINNHQYYHSDALKTDFNVYGKIFYDFSTKFNLFADVQYRKIGYYTKGDDSQQRQQLIDQNYDFFNPKIGLTYQHENTVIYGSVAVAHREPNRDDFTEATPENLPKPEQMTDFEAGFKTQKGSFAGGINAYFMNYNNQLVLTGKVNDVGNPIKINTPESYRAGIELETALQLSKKWKWNANATLSQNKIKNFTEAVINYDDYSYKSINHGNSDISFSPNVIAGSQLIFKPLKDLEFGLLSKYVGRQFLDNSSNTQRQLNAYFTNDLRLIYNIKPKKVIKELTISVLANNILNELYESNGYTYSYIYDKQTTTENFYYPQAGRNFLVGLGLKF